MSTHSSGFHPQYWERKKKKKDKIAATYLAQTTTLFGSPEGRGLLLQGLVEDKRLGESLAPLAGVAKNQKSQAALGVRFQKTQWKLCSSLVLLA